MVTDSPSTSSYGFRKFLAVTGAITAGTAFLGHRLKPSQVQWLKHFGPSYRPGIQGPPGSPRKQWLYIGNAKVQERLIWTSLNLNEYWGLVRGSPWRDGFRALNIATAWNGAFAFTCTCLVAYTLDVYTLKDFSIRMKSVFSRFSPQTEPPSEDEKELEEQAAAAQSMDDITRLLNNVYRVGIGESIEREGQESVDDKPKPTPDTSSEGWAPEVATGGS